MSLQAELLLLSSFQVAPAELEGYLAGHPLVADAGVTAVYSDDDATEYPIAYIVPRDTAIWEASRKLGKACPEGIALANELKAYIEEKTINYKWCACKLITVIHRKLNVQILPFFRLRGGIVLVELIPKSL